MMFLIVFGVLGFAFQYAEVCAVDSRKKQQREALEKLYGQQ